MFKFLLLATLVPLTIQQLTSSCTSCNSNTNSNYAHRFARSVPGFLGNYQGDAYTSNSRRQETLQLNQASNLKFSKLFPLRDNVNEDDPIIIEFVEEDDLEKNSEGPKQNQLSLNQKQKPQYDYVAFNIHPNGNILHQQGDMKYESSSSSSSSSYTNTAQSDDSSSSSVPGYLPDYQGDKYTNQQRILETQALNKAFFDSIGGAPSPPPLTPAQQGMNSTSNSTSSGSTGYSNTQQYSNTGSSTSSQNSNQVYYNPSSSSQQQYSTQQYGSNGQQQYSTQQYGTSNNNGQQYSNQQYSTQQYGSSNTNGQQQQYSTSSNCSATTLYVPASSYGYSTTSYNPNPTTTSTFYTNPTTTLGQQYDSVSSSNSNQNSEYYYQKVPSTQEYNAILGINAGFPQYVQQQQQLYDNNGNQASASSSFSSSTVQFTSSSSSPSYNTNTMQYISSTQQPSTSQYGSSYSTSQYSSSSAQPSYGSTTISPILYDQTTSSSSSSSSQLPSYSSDSISCCSQVSSTCCYQLNQQQGYGSQSNVMYSPSVYQYGGRK